MKKAVLLSALLALASVGVSAKEWKEIKLASEGAYPPFNETNADGSMRGFDIDLGNALCEQMQAKCTWVKQEWDGMIPGLTVKKYDAVIASMSITEDRKKKVAFTNKYYASPLALIAKDGSALRADPASLKGKKVAVQRGTVSDNFATKFWDGKGPEIVRYAKQDEAYMDLKSGRMDVALADYLEALGGFLQKPEGKGYSVAGEHIFGKTAEEKGEIGEGIGIAVRLKDQDLKEQLNKALAAMRSNGKYDQIRKKYFPMDIYGN